MSTQNISKEKNKVKITFSSYISYHTVQYLGSNLFFYVPYSLMSACIKKLCVFLGCDYTPGEENVHDNAYRDVKH